MDTIKLKCPECNGSKISANLLTCVTFTETDIEVGRSDVSYDQCAEATCKDCDHSAALHEFAVSPLVKRVVFTLECENAAFDDDLLGSVQAAFSEAAKMATRAIDNDKRLAFVRDVNGNQCGRIDIITE
jgi:hypothetical protein